MKNIIKTILLGAMISPAAHAANHSALTDMDFHNASPEKIKLGQFLFYDKIISGNKNTSCATCHHPLAGTGDGLALPVGEGGKGLGVTRDTGSGSDAIHERVPRNAPHLYNLGAKEFVTMFHDGRVTENPDHPSGFDSPAGDALPPGLDHSLAVQAMFPPTSNTEMAGQAGENPVADAAAAGDVTTVWRLLTERVMGIAEYRDLIHKAYPSVQDQDVSFVHIANAIGAFEATAFRADNSTFDRYLRGEINLGQAERMGFKIFQNNCMSCHSGPLQTDHQFHALGIPQIGPGKGDGLEGHDDYGREQVTGDSLDRYRFRTPTLRNVAVTGPWGHDGAYDTLEAMIQHHLHPEESLDNYDISQARLPPRADLDEIDRLVYDDMMSREELKASIEIQPLDLSEEDVTYLIDFLNALTDPASLDTRATVPYRVPSGLPIAD
ncbi:cytochrome c peroxidase [Methylomarinum sp. Ch1-1]|uniref:Cytochrome c peroxidase n=1 Tax=Methylomarinum roseum TaxID=3067653 RepID=A0AAU7NR51_9GAMM|nr:cytochrome c peroxidase [Methylomarinum sp. Ch1-1]MDP4520605.1 cytochrome c peroxidase [Methylomarinum sp. Ch1-1]